MFSQVQHSRYRLGRTTNQGHTAVCNLHVCGKCDACIETYVWVTKSNARRCVWLNLNLTCYSTQMQDALLAEFCPRVVVRKPEHQVLTIRLRLTFIATILVPQKKNGDTSTSAVPILAIRGNVAIDVLGMSSPVVAVSSLSGVSGTEHTTSIPPPTHSMPVGRNSSSIFWLSPFVPTLSEEPSSAKTFALRARGSDSGSDSTGAQHVRDLPAPTDTHTGRGALNLTHCTIAYTQRLVTSGNRVGIGTIPGNLLHRREEARHPYTLPIWFFRARYHSHVNSALARCYKWALGGAYR